ncbi:MAG: hypothetical protein HKP37_02780 [Boseongicola sp.]|nr:hypothetical protein [Boseongicola sp.]
MKVLFEHQNCPGQFKHLAPVLATLGDEVVFITQKGKPVVQGVRKIEYAPHREVTPKIHPYLVGSEAAVLNGQAVARIGLKRLCGTWPNLGAIITCRFALIRPEGRRDWRLRCRWGSTLIPTLLTR